MKDSHLDTAKRKPSTYSALKLVRTYDQQLENEPYCSGDITDTQAFRWTFGRSPGVVLGWLYR